ncbi:MAG: amidase [Burkholderiales bacterium]|nr:amidase [Burkholderiales bacterium]MDP2399643.1 amidase [Burkholderiales bacterium]
MANIPDDAIGAFCRHTHVALKGSGSGPLKGLSFGAKDIYDITGHRTGFGSPDWLATHEPATRTAPTVATLLAAGADMLGKTQTDELTYSLNGENAHYGTPVNVNAPGRIPGGSSSGSAAAVAGGLVDFALGSDTGGSVRAPASFCGVYGIRPTHGRVSLEGVCALAKSFDTAGWFARDAALLERVGRVLLGDVQASAHGSALLAEDAFALLDSAAREALQPALARIGVVLGAFRQVTVSTEGLPQWFQAFRVLQGAEIHAQLGDWVARVKPKLGPGVKERIEWTATITSAEVAQAQRLRDMARARMDSLLSGNAVLVLPTLPDIAPLLNTPPAQLDDFRAKAMSLLCIAGLAGLPQVTLPLATLKGCPLGVSLLAGRGNDAMLLALARRIAA